MDKKYLLAETSSRDGGSTVIKIDEGDFIGTGPIDVDSSAKGIVNTALFWIAILSVVMIVVGGILYATSSADETRTRRAKATIQYAVIGLAVALLSLAIVNWVIGVF